MDSIKVATLERAHRDFGYHPLVKSVKHIEATCPRKLQNLRLLDTRTTNNTEVLNLMVNGIIVALIAKSNKYLLEGNLSAYNDLVKKKI